MKALHLLALFGFITLPASAGTVSFGTFSIDFVDVGNAGNADDDTGYGGVPYNYQIGVYEISEGMITAANTAGSLGLTQDTRGVDKPATSISWNEAARFVNWLNTSNGFQPAYNFATQPGGGGYNTNEDLTLWSSGDAWQLGGENLFRHKNAHYFLPSEDEWYKAAYYDGNTSTYFDYATGSDTVPTAVASGTTPGTAVYGQAFATGPADIMNAGGLSPYGTMAQNGNVFEWAESGSAAPNDSAAEGRVLRGDWFFTSALRQSSDRSAGLPFEEAGFLGFRVAAVPEPSTLWIMVAGAISLMIRRKR
ncbi:MAG: SUMF1/EgtB/PvdO family nonheme iron enzyme [Verrucomicrobiae bacterium]|nr:SUMF1/EgtB/PvdO family nonheme iron enzyme [Verrucomicrobiae bacterium]